MEKKGKKSQILNLWEKSNMNLKSTALNPTNNLLKLKNISSCKKGKKEGNICGKSQGREQGLQPEWHLLHDGTLLQEVSNMGEEWGSLQQGGPNGFFLIILAFSWWVKAMGGGIDDVELHDTLVDAAWVVRCMIDMPAMPDQSIGGMHAWEDESDTLGKRQCVLSFPIASQANAYVTGEK
ncbi:hypothetical protein F5888DRAFT_1638456 [Russula emetica]|nr:hypothetical protein F5888DRAFT_1638456 [Russula emetica]